MYSFTFQLLGKVEFPNAKYGSQNKNPCDPDTRTEILGMITKWIIDVSSTSQCFFWLSGDPGIGKSAITASVAKECMRRGILWAQFFVNRNDARTVDPKILFPSIADQMSKLSHAVNDTVQKAYKELPYLLDEGISKDQALKLFHDTIWAACRLDSYKPVVIVIDALDETDITRLTNTVQIFAQVVTDLPYNAKVFISSRAEEAILNHFHPRLISNVRARHFHLSSDSKDSIDEVTKFIKRKIQEILKEVDLNETHWGQERTDMLCVRASGLFIWAVTAIEHIRYQIRQHGKECLRGLLDQLSAENMSDIDNLYRTIMAGTFQHNGTPEQHADSWPLQRFKRIIGAILARQDPLCIADLEGLLDLRNSSGDSADIEHFVRRLRVILVAGDGKINRQTIPRVHRSFYDFITSKGAGDFRVDMVNSHGELAIQCIRQLKQLWELGTPAQAWYAILYWSTHMTGAQLDMKAEVAAMDNDARSLTEANDTRTDPEPNACAWREVEVTNKGSNDDWKKAQTIDCMAISPDVFKFVFVQDGMMHLRGLIPEVANDWDLPAGDWVPSITFSPDSRYIVAPNGNSIYVRDSKTGQIVLRPLQGHTGRIFSAFFSPYGTHIVSASADNTIRIWDSSTGEMLSVWKGHADYVQSAVFSHDGQYIVSASSDKTICVWNVAHGNMILGPLKGHDACVRFAAFTGDGKHIISCDFEGTILVWDSVTGERVPSFWGDSDTDTARRLCFTNVETGSYIITPPRPTDDVSLGTSSGTLSNLSYSFCVDERGVTGGRATTNSSWLYADLDDRFILPAGMSVMLGCTAPNENKI
jgi:WD domain, G-beta repeat